MVDIFAIVPHPGVFFYSFREAEKHEPGWKIQHGVRQHGVVA